MFLFTKMQGTGNDFIILNYLKEKLEYSNKLLVKYLCDRHYGIGADGVILLEKSNIADFKMRIFNSDGEEAKMCGNGIRCIAKYIYEKELIEKNINEIKIETISGIKIVSIEIEGDTVTNIKVNMGHPIFDKSKIPMIYDEKAEKIIIKGIEIYPISIGNPHCVCFTKELENYDVEKYGKLIENYKYFPEKTNVEFVKIIDKNNIKIRVWERGVGETLSCGTGACASAIISQKYKNIENLVYVELLGGKLEIEYNDKLNEIYLKGPAEFVFEGEIKI